MSSKGAGGVAERRLRPLWDAIDTRQYKTALKLASALVVKHPDSAYLLVLKALILERMGKGDDAFPLCQRAKESGPSDDLTLNTLQIVFQRLDRLDQATLCYEHACTKNPNNLELLVGLFNCYVREYLYLKQQQTAMKMYKLIGEEKFLLWAICSIQLQVFCSNGDKTLLQLAEALMKKRIDAHGLQELEALLVYISVLEQQEKYKAAMDVLSSKLGGLFSIANDRLKLQGKLLLWSHQYKDAITILEDVLKTSSDDWTVFLQYLDASLECSRYNDLECTDDDKDFGRNTQSKKQGLPKEEVEKRLQRVSSFIQELQRMDSNDLKRAPFLGSVEVEKRRLQLKVFVDERHGFKSAGCSSALAVSIVQYFARFGNMVSFASDVENYLEFIEQNERASLIEQLHKACSHFQNETAVKFLRRRIVVHQVEVLLGLKASLSDKDVAAHAVEITKLYQESLQLSKDLDPQEAMHGEELLTIVTNLLIELFWRTKHIGYLLEAILVLEFGLMVRRFSFPYKIMLISLYSTISAVSMAFDLYKTLDVKNIMIETLSHHALPILLKSTLWPELETLLKEIIRFHDDYLREAADLTILAYRHCNYSKVLEFIQFKDRLQRSHQLLLARAEDSILQLKQKVDYPEEIEVLFAHINYGHQALEWSTEEKLSTLSFNEDLQSRPWWSPAPDECLLTDQSTSSDRPLNWRSKMSERHLLWREGQWRLIVRRRCLLPRLIYLSLRAVSMSKEAEIGESVSRPAVAELRQLIQSFGDTLGWSWDQLEQKLSDFTFSKKSLKSSNLQASDLVSLSVFWTAYQIASQPFSLLCSSKGLLRALGFVNKLVENFLAELTQVTVVDSHDIFRTNLCIKMISSGSSLPMLVCLTTEAFAWLGLCLQVWVRCLQPVSKKKKKGTGPAEQTDSSLNKNPISLLDALQDSLNIFCFQLEGFISWLKELLERPEEDEVKCYLSSLTTARRDLGGVVNDLPPVPGLIIQFLQSSVKTDEFGDRLGHAIQTWQPDRILQNIVRGQRTTLTALKEKSASRLKILRALKT